MTAASEMLELNISFSMTSEREVKYKVNNSEIIIAYKKKCFM
jgi:hypothetical protein